MNVTDTVNEKNVITPNKVEHTFKCSESDSDIGFVIINAYDKVYALYNEEYFFSRYLLDQQ